MSELFKACEELINAPHQEHFAVRFNNEENVAFDKIRAIVESGKDELTFSELREANVERLPQFKNSKGEPAHSEPDGSDWKLSAWCNAVTGELGELANKIKKVERGDYTLEEMKEDLGKELADVQTYLDILAFRIGIDLGEATVNKFNEVSDRVGCDVKL